MWYFVAVVLNNDRIFRADCRNATQQVGTIKIKKYNPRLLFRQISPSLPLINGANNKVRYSLQ